LEEIDYMAKFSGYYEAAYPAITAHSDNRGLRILTQIVADMSGADGPISRAVSLSRTPRNLSP